MFVGAAGGSRRATVLAAALSSLGCTFVAPSAANAVTFTVNSTADEADAAVNGTCFAAVTEKCTLRAAIEEANPTSTNDIVNFEASIFDGSAAGEIALNSGLPKIVNPIRIRGACVPSGGSLRPCVGIEGKSSEAALAIENAAGVQIDGLAITGAQTGIAMKNAASFRLRTTWLGAKLDGSIDGNATGFFAGPGSGGQVGSEGPGFGNVFADSSGDGLQLEGVAGTTVLGNYFGVAPDGVTPAGNGEDIEIASVSGSPATGNSIGTKVSAAAAATPACDGGCNVISGAGSNGIDLQGDGGSEEPAQATTVRGNYVGLNASGNAAIPNSGTGILVGGAEQTVIGGPKVEEANRINGGSVAVLAGPGAGDLVVHGNRIGADSAGTGILDPPEEGIAVDSEGLTSPAVEAAIVDNQIRMESGVAISQQGFGARIADNEVDGAETGIEVFGETEEHGNLIEGNSLEGPGENGIIVASSFNEIVGNEVFGAGEAGVLIEGEAPSGVTGNVVGGNAAADENVITGSAGDAIEIVDVENTDNEIARNRGIVNGGLFIELVALSEVEPKWPNHGIEPPTFATSATGSSGTAEAGARVRVFRKQAAEAGELDSFLGEAIADPSGEWEVAYGNSLPSGAIVAATQTSALGGTSELATATVATESGGGGGGGGGGAGGAGATALASTAGDQTAPETALLKAPKKKIHGDTARFEFDSDEVGTTFQCKLDDKQFKACKSPKKYGGLRSGKHVFRVRAVDSAGNVDPSPAKRKFTVLDGGAR